MTIDTFSKHGSASPRQNPLVASFDPWQAEHTFSLFDQPYPGISRAMLGPQGIGNMAPTADKQRRCLAVATGGALIASTWVSPAPINAPDNMWQQVLYELALARQRPYQYTDLHWHATPEDCLKRWSNPAFWDPELRHDPRNFRREGFEVQTKCTDQITAGVLFVFHALEPVLCTVLTHRPRLGAMTAVRLLSLAARHSVAARAYAVEALRTESMGVLDLMAYGQLTADAHLVRESIFCGRGVPDAFAELGVAKASRQSKLLLSK